MKPGGSELIATNISDVKEAASKAISAIMTQQKVQNNLETESKVWLLQTMCRSMEIITISTACPPCTLNVVKHNFCKNEIIIVRNEGSRKMSKLASTIKGIFRSRNRMSKRRSGEATYSSNSNKAPVCWFFQYLLPSWVGFTLRLFMETAPYSSSWLLTHGGKMAAAVPDLRTHHRLRKGRTFLLVAPIEERESFSFPEALEKVFLWFGASD